MSAQHCICLCVVLGDEVAQVGPADRKLPTVSGALERPHHTSRAEPEGERPRPLPPDRPKRSREVGVGACREETHVVLHGKLFRTAFLECNMSPNMLGKQRAAARQLAAQVRRDVPDDLYQTISGQTHPAVFSTSVLQV